MGNIPGVSGFQAGDIVSLAMLLKPEAGPGVCGRCAHAFLPTWECSIHAHCLMCKAGMWNWVHCLCIAKRSVAHTRGKGGHEAYCSPSVMPWAQVHPEGKVTVNNDNLWLWLLVYVAASFLEAFPSSSLVEIARMLPFLP